MAEVQRLSLQTFEGIVAQCYMKQALVVGASVSVVRDLSSVFSFHLRRQRFRLFFAHQQIPVLKYRCERSSGWNETDGCPRVNN